MQTNYTKLCSKPFLYHKGKIPWSGKQAIDERILLVFSVENKDVLCKEKIKGENGEKKHKCQLKGIQIKF